MDLKLHFFDNFYWYWKTFFKWYLFLKTICNTEHFGKSQIDYLVLMVSLLLVFMGIVNDKLKLVTLFGKNKIATKVRFLNPSNLIVMSERFSFWICSGSAWPGRRKSRWQQTGYGRISINNRRSFRGKTFFLKGLPFEQRLIYIKGNFCVCSTIFWCCSF